MHRPKMTILRVFVMGVCSLLLMGALQQLKTNHSLGQPKPDLSADTLFQSGDHRGALQIHEQILVSLSPADTLQRARRHFLAGIAANVVFRKEGLAEYRTACIRHFEAAVDLDPTPWGAYRVPSLFEMSARDLDPPAELRESLLNLINEPQTSVHPLVTGGLIHQRLAEWIQQENPEEAIALLEESHRRKGPNADGTETLLMGAIRLHRLADADGALQLQEQVLRMASAGAEVRAEAQALRDRILESDYTETREFTGESADPFLR